ILKDAGPPEITLTLPKGLFLLEVTSSFYLCRLPEQLFALFPHLHFFKRFFTSSFSSSFREKSTIERISIS
ncbi:hypothetical protein, partial [Lysinibacillus fusiformis]|uniref:hypothetical protein n=1 Tax=Lysinibacillus fusiformis TaxID=28031 RepID=UPI0020C15EBF